VPLLRILLIITIVTLAAVIIGSTSRTPQAPPPPETPVNEVLAPQSPLVAPETAPPPAPVKPAPPKPAVVATTTKPLSKYEALLLRQETEGQVNLRDEEELWASVVAIRCSYPLATGGNATVAGSGIVLDNAGIIVSNNHVVDHGPETKCEALFPAFSENTYFRIRAFGTFPAATVTKSGNSINDIAILRVEKSANFVERVAYLRQYYGWAGEPFHPLPYPVCRSIATGDQIIHYDWQVINAAAGGYEALRTVGVVAEFLSVNNGLFSITGEGLIPRYAVTNITKRGGASGGLAFNASRDCFLGLISRATENLAYILYLNHPDARDILSKAL